MLNWFTPIVEICFHHIWYETPITSCISWQWLRYIKSSINFLISLEHFGMSPLLPHRWKHQMYVCLSNNHRTEQMESPDDVLVSFWNMDRLVLRDLIAFYTLATLVWTSEKVLNRFKRRQVRRKRIKRRTIRGQKRAINDMITMSIVESVWASK